MLLLNELIAVYNDLLCGANIKFLDNLISCFYCVQKDITVRSLSRYSEYSTRSFFRFLKRDVDWVSLRMALVSKFVLNSKDERVYVLALDETVEGKSRKSTYGMSRFFSSTLDKVITGVSFSAISLIDTKEAISYMLGVEQLIYTDKDRARISAQKEEKKEAKKTSSGWASEAKREATK
ncbi:MAG: transposase [Saprospiraceae bacterium]|nr:transposase [Saprospiraceae bacterium]